MVCQTVFDVIVSIWEPMGRCLERLTSTHMAALIAPFAGAGSVFIVVVDISLWGLRLLLAASLDERGKVHDFYKSSLPLNRSTFPAHRLYKRK